MKATFLSILIITFWFMGCKENEPVPQSVKIYELTETVNGLTYADLEEISTKWLLSAPLKNSPALDEDGSLALGKNQPNANVTILPFNLGGISNRKLTVPASKPIYFGILGISAWYFENDPCDPDFKPAPGQSVEQFLNPLIEASFKDPHSISAQLDGKDIVPDLKKYLVKTKAFDFIAPEEFQDPTCGTIGQKAHSVAHSYSLLIKLPKGKYKLSYGGAFPNSDPELDFKTEVNWELTVE